MAKSHIISAITAKIAAATTSTESSELGLLKVIGKKLGINTNNVTTQANTISNSATVSTDTTDLLLLNQAITEYEGKSYVGEIRPMSSLLPEKVTTEDGAVWIKQGFYETDPSKVNASVFPYACIGSVGGTSTLGYSTITYPSNSMTGECVVLNSGRIVSFGYGGQSAALVYHDDPEIAGTQLLASVNIYDYDYDYATDTLYLIVSGGSLYKITNNGTTLATITAATIGFADSSQRCVMVVGNSVYVGGKNLIKVSTNGGSSWSTYTISGLAADYYIHRMAFESATNRFYVIGIATTTTDFNRASELITIYCSTSGGAFGHMTTLNMGFVYKINNVDGIISFLIDYAPATLVTPAIYTLSNGIATQAFAVSPVTTNKRPKLLYIPQHNFFVYLYCNTDSDQKIAAIKIRIYSVDFLIINTTSLAIGAGPGTTTSMSSTRMAFWNNALYFRATGVNVKKLPLYGITNANTPFSFLRVL